MKANSNADDPVVITRELDAPVALVWAMWTEPEHLQAWYGPGDVTITVRVMDVRPGGRRLVGMEIPTPDGPMQRWFAGEYREVVPTRHLVYTDLLADEAGTPIDAAEHPPTEVRVELEAVGDRTKMTLTHVGIPSDSPGAVGWSMAFDKLAAVLLARRPR